ncbi:XRE family transcriptional regulator [Pseudomonas kermanshahensis]|uniref:helix-turn-helix domain-containing protein n=1 Tax=Pseudomonas kermanshahensis TaxID=2745482 RepID=UPI0023DA10B6|nr:XRE family transcriptional regulator [Pseudomonas kermanshahensis]WEL57505.1 XRE family transcriptional regulator [Pseudomonas kermanshahensis]
MLTREALAAVLRSIRADRGLTREAVPAVETRTLFNLENAKTGVTIETLQKVADGLEIHPLTLQILATSTDDGIAPSELLKILAKELRALENSGVVAKISHHIVNGKLIPERAGKRHSQETIDAVKSLKAEGKTQKEIYETLGLSRSTVGRIWKSLESF